MGSNNFYDRLLTLPLFQGLGRDDFLTIAARIRWAFSQKKAGQTIVKQDEPCRNLIFILKGEVETVRSSDLRNYALHEWLNMPCVIQPEAFFGLFTSYTRSVIAVTDVQLLTIDKETLLDELFKYKIVRINYLNLLSTRQQYTERYLWRKNPETLAHRFISFVASRCIRPAGKKMLHINMNPLGKELLATRLNVSLMLNELQDEGLVELGRGRIIIPYMEKLLIR